MYPTGYPANPYIFENVCTINMFGKLIKYLSILKSETTNSIYAWSTIINAFGNLLANSTI